MTCSEHTGLVKEVEGLRDLMRERFDSQGRELRDVKKLVQWLVVAVFTLALAVGGVKLATDILSPIPVAASQVQQ